MPNEKKGFNGDPLGNVFVFHLKTCFLKIEQNLQKVGGQNGLKRFGQNGQNDLKLTLLIALQPGIPSRLFQLIVF